MRTVAGTWVRAVSNAVIMSAVWIYFKLKEEKIQTAKCNLCNASVWGGDSSVGNFNTTNLKTCRSIMERSMPNLYEQWMPKRKVCRNNKHCWKQFQKHEILPSDSDKAKLITEKVAEFIVLDDQHLSVVENVDFQHLNIWNLATRCQTGISSAKLLSQINTSKCANSFWNVWKTLPWLDS